jgi:protein-L-isoaspartate(D-aspartate) O-methyltransferase
MDRQTLVDLYRRLDRAAFLEDSCKSLAGLDEPLPIGFGQTISQPSLVLEMTARLDPNPDSYVLEIGTGSGYQTALLAACSGTVCTVERIAMLSERARQRLDKLGYSNIRFRVGDGSDGWPEAAPFDRIMVTAAASIVPPALVAQLKPGGRMIIPVGPRGWQDLLLIEKTARGQVRRTVIETVSFVELVGSCGWNPQTGPDHG